MADQLRWGILGAAGIAAKQFLPALAEAGGAAEAVAARDQERATHWAAQHGVRRVLPSYQDVIDDPGVDAVYIPLPNALHAEAAIAALRAGKPVLCEKPLTGSVAGTDRVLAAAADTGTLLWEAFVFPFHHQLTRIRALLADGAIGELREIHSTFQFPLRDPGDIRMSAKLAGGALHDVGCYPVQLALHLFGVAHELAVAGAQFAPGGVDTDLWGCLGFPGERRLLLSCGFGRAVDTASRLLGTEGTIAMTSSFHPGPGDRFEVRRPGREPASYPAGGPDRCSFTPALRHIQAAVAGREEPRYLAAETSGRSARAMADLLDSAREPG